VLAEFECQVAAAAEAGQAAPPEAGFDVRLEKAMRADALALFEKVMSAAGQAAPYGKPDGYRDVTVCCVLGYATYARAYYAPAAERRTRQMRRADERLKAEAEKRERRKRGGDFPRHGGAPCAYPLDKALGLVDGMTPGMQERMQRAACMAGSFAEGSSALKLLSGVNIPAATFRRKALAAGGRAAEAQEFPVMRILSPFLPAWLLAVTAEVTPTIYIMLDGTGVPCVRKDTEGVKGKGEDGRAGTREVKVGIVGTYRRTDARGRPVRDPLCESHIVSMKDAQAFGTLLRRLAFSRGYGADYRIQIVGDGAEWIANIVKTAFPDKDVIFTNDFFHACEYLHAAITLAEKDVANIAKVYKAAKAVLYRFGGASLIKHMRKRYAKLDASHEAWKKLGYIEDRLEHMKYGEYRKQGLYIGSGLIESACRTDVARRCKQSGMHWRFKNAAYMCALVARFRSNLHAA
jgi:hypothetical protein